jgi:uncharacterized membrane protein
MEALLLSIHVVAGILFVGPIAVATSLFTRYVPVTVAADDAASGVRSAEVARLLHRITRVYGILALVVPVGGIALALVQARATEIWVIVAIVLTAMAGGLLALQIVPQQREALADSDDEASLRALAMTAGIFNLLWAVVVVLMVVRPGSSH